MGRTLLGALLLAGFTACSQTSLEPLPLEVDIAASRTTTVPGDTISFLVNARGGTLVGLEIDFGDSTTDQFGTSGARTAQVTFRHAYVVRGTYMARVVVTDALAGQKDASIEIRVN